MSVGCETTLSADREKVMAVAVVASCLDGLGA
jgi:hypothetical protein